MLTQLILIIVGSILAIYVGIFIMIGLIHKKITQGQALIRTGFGDNKVVFENGIFVFPFLHKLEKLDLRIKQIEVSFLGNKAIQLKDNQTAEYKAIFFIHVQKRADQILKAAQFFGVAGTFDQELLQKHFQPIFSTAIKKVAREFDANTIYEQLDQFDIKILERIGTSLNGYNIDHIVSDHLEVLP